MRKVTEQICKAFLAGKEKVVGNSHTDGRNLYLFGNRIAQRRQDGIVMHHCGFNTSTTRERLGGLLYLMGRLDLGASREKGILGIDIRDKPRGENRVEFSDTGPLFVMSDNYATMYGADNDLSPTEFVD